MRRGLLLISCVLWALGCGGSAAEPPATTPSDAGPEVEPPAPQTLSIRDVDVYQAIQIPLFHNGERADGRNAPIIAGRDAFIRVGVKPDIGWKRQPVNATLTITSAAKGTTEKKLRREVSASGSTDANLSSTLNFEIEKELITRDATIVITIALDDAELARFPADVDVEPLQAVVTGPLKVQIVPVKWDADGSGRVPDTSASALEMYRSALFGMYPVTEVQLTVREPYAWNETVTADGTGWDTLLSAIVDLRNADKTPSDVYYYGLFRPHETFWKYCQMGCVAGLSGLLRDPADSMSRGSIGLGYGDDSAKTMAHEIGHAHGRAHAPCGDARGIDKSFPYPGGEIGVYGWDPVEKQLIDSSYSDVMGYCNPVWVSDYTYKALYSRVSFVTKNPYFISTGGEQRYRFVLVGRDGKLTWGRSTITSNVPMAEKHTVTFTAADGTTRTVTGHYYPYADLEGGYLIVPEPESPLAKLTVEGMAPGVQRELIKFTPR